MSTEELKIYLYHVYQLEKQKYMIESTYASLQKEIKQAKYVIEQNRNIELADDSMHVSKSSYLQMYVMGMLIGGYFIGGIGYFIDILTTKMDGLNGFIEKVLSILFIVLWPMGELVTGPSFSQWIKSWNGILLTGVFLIITVGVIVLYILERNSTREENIQNKKYNEEIIISSKQKIYEKEKYINLEFIKQKEQIIITVRNTCTSRVNIKNLTKNGFTTKGKNHGYGLSLVSDIVRKDDSLDIKFECDDDIFSATLVIRL